MIAGKYINIWFEYSQTGTQSSLIAKSNYQKKKEQQRLEQEMKEMQLNSAEALAEEIRMLKRELAEKDIDLEEHQKDADPSDRANAFSISSVISSSTSNSTSPFLILLY